MSVRLFLSTKVLHKTFLGSSETSCTFKSSIEKHFLGTAKAYALIALSKQPSCSSSPSGLTVPEGFDASSRIHHRTDTGTPRFTTHLKLKKNIDCTGLCFILQEDVSDLLCKVVRERIPPLPGTFFVCEFNSVQRTGNILQTKS